jgi:signal peptidase I
MSEPVNFFEEKLKFSPLKTFFLSFLLILALKFCLFDIMLSEGRSMLPVIPPGALLFVNRAAYGFRLPWSQYYSIRWGFPKKGDVVIFASPEGKLAVKRVGGIEQGGFILLLGDNQEESYDSRAYGALPIDSIVGKVIGIK